MFVSGFTIARNAEESGSPVVESVKSMFPLCDELIVNVGNSSDATSSLIRYIGNEKLEIFQRERIKQDHRFKLTLKTRKRLGGWQPEF